VSVAGHWWWFVVSERTSRQFDLHQMRPLAWQLPVTLALLIAGNYMSSHIFAHCASTPPHFYCGFLLACLHLPVDCLALPFSAGGCGPRDQPHQPQPQPDVLLVSMSKRRRGR